MEQATTEIMVGKTLFIITAEYSATATETLEQKLKKLITQHASDKVIGELSINGVNQLDVCGDQSEHGQYQTETGRISDEEETS